MPKDPYWKIAKELLIQDIAGEFIPDEMDSSQVQLLRPEYLVCLKYNFKRNLQLLRQRIKEKAAIAQNDFVMLNRDRIAFPKTGASKFNYPRWPGSAAEQFLKHDISNELHLSLKPQTFS